MGKMDFIIIILLALASLSSTLSFIILFFMRKEIQDIQQSVDYELIYRIEVFIDRIVNQARKEKGQ